MKAEDTVIDGERMLCCSLRGKYCFDEVKDIILDTAIAQAEISFKAGYDKALAQLADMTEECKQMGRRDVVELDKDIMQHILQDGKGDWSIDSWRLKAFLKRRQAKLKEWGIE